MTIARENLPAGTTKLTLTIPKERVAKVREEELTKALKEIQVPGFRKGKAPKRLAEEKVDKEKLLQRVINCLIPEIYQEAIQKESLKPIVSPKIRLISAQEDKDWQVEIQTCEAPEVKLGDYKQEIRKLNVSSKIWVPNKKLATAKGTEPQRSVGGAEGTENRDQRLQKILNALLQSIKLEIPALLIENELNRRLAALINKTEKLGMTLEQYLASINQSAEQLKENYRKASQEFWQLELILNKIADEEKIAVSQAEIDKAIKQTKTEKEKKALNSQRYFLAQLLRRQKTLDFLLSL